MSWISDPFLCLDVETTGVDPFEDRIVQVAAVMVGAQGQTSYSYSTIVDPGVEVPAEAALIHGISTSRAMAEGVKPAEALSQVAELIFDHGHRPVVMFNARFDWPMLMAEAERHGVDFPVIAPVLDPYLIDRMVDRYRTGGRKLTAVCRHYEVPLTDEEAHGALADAIAAGRVMHQIIERYPAIAEHTLAGVFLRQVKGAEEDRLRFLDWRRRNVDPEFRSQAGWPIPTGLEVGA